MINEWLKNAIFYEVYPTSFYDSDNDGIGDLKGICQKLEYIKDLGCNGIWMNPFYTSPFCDGGYDISDYKQVDKKFGTIEDVRNLCKRAKELGIKIIFDLVPGHTSDQHPWFKDSAKTNPGKYKDYYIWTNSGLESDSNLRMINGTQKRNGAFAINFFAFQPSLNYGFANPTEPWQMGYKDERLLPLRKEIIDIICFWLDKGCDGFRIDMAWSLVKNDYDGKANAWLWDQILSEVKKQYPDALFIPETGNPYVTIPSGFDMDFCFQINEPYYSLVRYEPGTNNADFAMKGKNYFATHGEGSIECFATEYPKLLDFVKNRGYIAIPSGNHDIPRISVNRDELDLKIFYAFLLTVPNVPFIYYGDEIGMEYNSDLTTKDGGYLRTGSRTPMMWNDGINKGFSNCESNELYLPINTEGETVAHEQQRKDSLLNFIKELIKLRKEENINAGSELEIIRDNKEGYPAGFKVNNILTVINPASKSCEIKVNDKYEVIYSCNGNLVDNKMHFSDKGYAILKKQ